MVLTLATRLCVALVFVGGINCAFLGYGSLEVADDGDIATVENDILSEEDVIGDDVNADDSGVTDRLDTIIGLLKALPKKVVKEINSERQSFQESLRKNRPKVNHKSKETIHVVKSASLDRVYVVVDTGMRWYTATSYCTRHGTKLVELRTKEQSDFLKKQAQKIFKNTSMHKELWTAGNRRNARDTWVWGEDDTSKKMKFTDWGQRQPSNSGGNEQCLSFLRYKWFNTGDYNKFKWNDLPCRQSTPFICEQNLSKKSTIDKAWLALIKD